MESQRETRAYRQVPIEELRRLVWQLVAAEWPLDERQERVRWEVQNELDARVRDLTA